MPNETITITIERYEELLHKEAVYDIQRDMTSINKYRTSIDSCMYGVPTLEEEKQYEAEKQTFKEWLEDIAKEFPASYEEDDF